MEIGWTRQEVDSEIEGNDDARSQLLLRGEGSQEEAYATMNTYYQGEVSYQMANDDPLVDFDMLLQPRSYSEAAYDPRVTRLSACCPQMNTRMSARCPPMDTNGSVCRSPVDMGMFSCRPLMGTRMSARCPQINARNSAHYPPVDTNWSVCRSPMDMGMSSCRPLMGNLISAYPSEEIQRERFSCRLPMDTRMSMRRPRTEMTKCARVPMDSRMSVRYPPISTKSSARLPMDTRRSAHFPPICTGVTSQAHSPMDTIISADKSQMLGISPNTDDEISSKSDQDDIDSTIKEFTKATLFEAVSQGKPSKLNGLLDYLKVKDLKLTSKDFTEKNGKTALLKALLNLKEGKNDTIEVLLKIAEETGDLKNFINASYQDPVYKGQTALHVAIERRNLDYVKLLVEKGANVQAKACGEFFQDTEKGFYFGELPLSLAACTNQPDIVTFLMENGAKAEETDFRENIVLHTLVVIAENSPESTEMITEMYDHVLTEYIRLEEKQTDYLKLENTPNKNGLTPLKLAAKLGKIGLLKHILHREFTGGKLEKMEKLKKMEKMKKMEMMKKLKKLSRKITDDWVYGPVRSSLYDTRSIETDEKNSVLKIVVFGSDVSNRPEMLQIEPLRSLLQDKWDQFASKIFWMNFLFYLLYVSIFTVVTVYRKKGQPPFPIENSAQDVFRFIGQLIIVIGAIWFLYSTIKLFVRHPSMIKNLHMDGFSDILFFLQALLLLISVVLYLCGLTEYVDLLVLSLALAWYNILYFLRGSRRMGMYSVMMQRMILVDLFHFLCVYSVMLLGFSAAILALYEQTPHEGELSDATVVEEMSDLEPVKCEEPCYNTLRKIVLEMCKFTIGMGDLELAKGIQHQRVFYILLTLYIILTYILLLNMLIALMGSTVDSTSTESENIWNLQRASTILKIERNIPKFLRDKLCPKRPETDTINGCKFYRVDEMNWTQWKSALGKNRDEDAGDDIPKPPLSTRWPLVSALQRLRPQQRSHSVV